MDITPRKRSKIIALNEHTSMTVRDIATAVGVGKSSVSRILTTFQDSGSSSPKRKGKCGRKRKTTPRSDKILIRNSKINPRKTSTDLRRDLLDFGVEVSTSTVRKRLLEVGRKAKRPRKKQFITQKMMKKRLAWAKKYRSWTVNDWKKVIFSDETHLFVQGYKSSVVRRSEGETLRPDHIQQTVKHPSKQMFWGFFTTNGTGSLVPITGMMNSVKYIEILRSRIVPFMETFDGTFQHDLAPCHNSKLVQTFMRENKITVLDWPGNSPDLNPIENLWHILKNRLAKMNCTTKERMITSAIQVWFHDDEVKNICAKLVESMPRRVEEVISAKGGHTSY